MLKTTCISILKNDNSDYNNVNSESHNNDKNNNSEQ